jgi:transcription initiation factor TFIIIB Brf1 subunit/transcription initiation factor TFIIB
LVCPACQESGNWTAELESCSRCGSVHLIRRLGQVDCLDCGLVREPEPALVSAGRPASASPDTTLAEEVGRALDRLLGRS